MRATKAPTMRRRPRGRPAMIKLPEDQIVKVGLSLKNGLNDRLTEYAQYYQRTKSEIVAELVEKFLDKEDGR